MDYSFCDVADATFGPQITSSCRTFDFTRLFEEAFLSIAPSTVFLIFASFRASRIFSKQPIVRKGRLHGFKLVAITLLVVAEVAQLVLASFTPYVKVPTTTAANVLAMVATLPMLLLSHLEHCKALRPSSILCIYLFFTLLLDIPRARTLWMSHQWVAASATLQAAMVIKVSILLLELQTKVRLLVQTDRHLSPEESSNVFSRRLFWWLNQLFRKGYSKSLALPDLYALDEELASRTVGSRLEKAWNSRRDHASEYSLAISLCEAFVWAVAAPILPRLCLTGFIYSQPFLVQAVTNFLQQSPQDAPDNWGYGLIGAYFFVYSGIALSNGWYWHKQYRLITMVRGSLVSLIYSKTLRMGVEMTSDAEATTLMSADVEQIAVGLRSLQEVWGGSLDLGVGLWLLYRQVSWAMFSMAGLTLEALWFVLAAATNMGTVCTLGAAKTAQYARTRQNLWMDRMQKRLSETIKAIGSLKSIKMLGFEDTIYPMVQGLRQHELKAMVHFRIATTANVTLAHASIFLNSVVVLAAFLPIANRDGLLYDTNRIFNTLTLVSIMSEPLQSLLQALPKMAMAIGCISRIQAYLLTVDYHDPRHCPDSKPSSSDNDSSLKLEVKAPVNTFVVRNGHFGWVEGKSAVLRNVNATIPAGKITLVVGPVGSGKTTLLHTLLGETVRIKGEVLHTRQAIAFCAQQPWLTNTTARKAIIGHSQEDPAWYDRVVKACALHRDFAEMAKGDQTVIGSSGAALSGGQKQRMALARAVYSRKPVIILDDVLSGLDMPTERFLFNALFGPDGIFRTALPDTTIVLATHAIQHLKSADHIIVMLPNGDGLDEGDMAELSSRGRILQTPQDVKDLEEDDLQGEGDQPVRGEKMEQPISSHEEIKPHETNALRFYVKSMGFWNIVAFIAMGVVTVGLWKVSEYWARVWAEHSERHPADPRASYYVGIYALMNAIAVIAAGLWFGHFLLVIVPKTGLDFHERMLRTTLNATYPFLSRTDTGALATRFGQDLFIVDTELPNSTANTAFLFLIVVAQLGLIASASTYIIAAFPVFALAMYAVQRVYLRTSQRIRHMDLETKAPLYAQFTDALNGAASIRAFNWQSPSRNENDTLLDNNQRPFYLLFCVQRWLECVLDCTVAGLAVLLVGIAVATRSRVGSAQMGVALLNVVSLGESMKSLVKHWTTMETSIAAVARIQDFVETTPQESPSQHESAGSRPEIDANGGMALTLTNVSAKYSANGSNVLSDLSLDIAPGEKIAICGRSGSGKSSFLNVILKMMDITGELHVGHRLSSSFGNQELRHNLNTIPQDPYFFPGTIRKNLDPDSTSSDAAIQALIARVGLENEIAKCGGLNGELPIESFSAGQLQLLSLARGVLNPKGLLLLDEATSSVDYETDKKMHDMIFEDFAGQTVIAILHRRDELHRFDRVVVVDQGRVVSVGKPGVVKLEM